MGKNDQQEAREAKRRGVVARLDQDRTRDKAAAIRSGEHGALGRKLMSDQDFAALMRKEMANTAAARSKRR